VPAVEVTGLTVRYGPAGTPAAVDGLDLTAAAGEVLVVLGPNGAGKTSTVETLEGYRRPAAGRVRVLGLNPVTDHAALSGRIGVMLQRGGVYPMLGPRRVLDLFAGYYPAPVPADELLDLVGLRGVADTPWRHLSGGEQQRLSLALALVGRPDAAFLDEPTAGVDPEGRIAVRGVVAGLKEKGVCVILTTHELGEAEKMADRIMILAAGRVVLEGTPQGLTAAAPGAGPRVVTFGAPAALDVVALAAAVGPGTTVVETAPGRYRVEASEVETPAVAVAAAVTNFLAARDATLTDLATVSK
jgi:ABC-2 type transport system ATP-binding protein